MSFDLSEAHRRRNQADLLAKTLERRKVCFKGCAPRLEAFQLTL
jgi:hypothetical protein